MEERIIKTLKGLLPKFKYRGLEWVERLRPPVGIFRDFVIVMLGFYSENGAAYEGVCSELVAQAYLDLRRIHPELHEQGRIYRVAGADPTYFGAQKEGHSFIILTDLEKVVNHLNRITEEAEPSFNLSQYQKYVMTS